MHSSAVARINSNSYIDLLETMKIHLRSDCVSGGGSNRSIDRSSSLCAKIGVQRRTTGFYNYKSYNDDILHTDLHNLLWYSHSKKELAFGDFVENTLCTIMSCGGRVVFLRGIFRTNSRWHYVDSLSSFYEIIVFVASKAFNKWLQIRIL